MPNFEEIWPSNRQKNGQYKRNAIGKDIRRKHKRNTGVMDVRGTQIEGGSTRQAPRNVQEERNW